MILYRLETFVDQTELDALKVAIVHFPATSVLHHALKGMLDPANIEVLDDELTYSDSSRFNGEFDGEPE